jgi:hypothetical protein
MSRIQPKLSPTDQHAKRIATAIVKGRRPAPTPALKFYLDSSPREIFAAFEGATRHMPPAGNDEALALGYLFVLEQLLEHLRYRTDSGHPDAAKLIADFQTEVAARAKTGHIDASLLTMVGSILHQARIPASPELTAVSEKDIDFDDEDEDPQFLADVDAGLAGLLDACGGDPFFLVGSLAEFGHAMPARTRAMLAAAFACEAKPGGRAGAVLFLLDSDPVVRRGVSAALVEVAPSLSPTDIRRLIAIRNWRPESERVEVDAIVHKARAAGIECAQWEAGSVETILSTAVDGSGAQGILLVSPAGRKKRLSSILTKGGIADAWSGEPESGRRIDATIAKSGTDTPILAVSRSYLDSVVAHHLALSLEKGASPPLGFAPSRRNTRRRRLATRSHGFQPNASRHNRGDSEGDAATG